jgi:stage II sporulation protein P
MTFIYEPQKNRENTLLEKIYSISHIDLDSKKSSSEPANSSIEVNNSSKSKTIVKHNLQNSLEPEERDEFEPTMDSLLLNERELTIKDIDALFENMKSPKEISTTHSTFGKKVVYIYHTHSRESFLPYLKDTDKPEEAYHSNANITLVGKLLGRALKRRGIGTTVDTTDIVQELDLKGLNYNSSYNLSGELVRSALRDNKDLEIFIDVHRDSLRKDSTTTEVNGLNYANLLFVIGTGHESYEKNIAFAEGLQTILDIKYPSLSKGIIKKDSNQGNGVYNQEISPNAIIVEIGGVDNTVEELHRSTEIFADVLSQYYFHEEK